MMPVPPHGRWIHGEVDAARARLGEMVVGAMSTLEADEAYRFQQQRVETVSAQAERAAENAAQAEADRQAKGRPYEEDEPFAYLWKRQYVTSAYRAGNLATALDGWVARLCKYDRARLDYAMLLEILRANLEREPVSTLRADAARTRSPADDALVAGIVAHRDEARGLQAEAGPLRKRQTEAMAALNDLEEVRRRYRRSNYDARDSTFSDGLDTEGLLNLLLKGGAVIGDVLGEMNKNHRFEVPRHRSGPAGGGFRRPSSSPPRCRPSGGFRTGGGF